MIGIIGLGYVGMSLMLRCCEVDYKVIAFDLNQDKIDTLSRGKSYIEHIPDEMIQANCSQFEPTCDFSRALEVDVLVLCVPTPLNKYREPNLSFIINTIDSLLPYLRPGQMVCPESTTYPGTTD